MFSLEFLTGVSVAAGTLTYHVIPKFRDMFLKANLFGIDLNKSSGEKVPEATGVITGSQNINNVFSHLILLKLEKIKNNTPIEPR